MDGQFAGEIASGCAALAYAGWFWRKSRSAGRNAVRVLYAGGLVAGAAAFFTLALTHSLVAARDRLEARTAFHLAVLVAAVSIVALTASVVLLAVRRIRRATDAQRG